MNRRNSRAKRPLWLIPVVLVGFGARATPLLGDESAVITSAIGREAVSQNGNSVAAGNAVANDDRFELGQGGQLMLYFSQTQTVLQVQGPGAFTVEIVKGRDGCRVDSGRFAINSMAAGGNAFTMSLASSAGPLEFKAPKGSAYVVSLGVGHQEFGIDEQGGGIGATVGGQVLAPGQALAFEGGRQSSLSFGEWASANTSLLAGEFGFRLGIASARARREVVDAELFKKLVEWDQYIGGGTKRKSIQQQTRAEIRTTAQTVNSAQESTTPSTTPNRSQGAQGANQVPAISPAAVVAGGFVQATANNAQARRLLTQTGSQGLGFNGLQQLAVPGRVGGVPTVGPAGVAGGR